MPAKEAAHAASAIDVAGSGRDAAPGAGVLLELRVRGLKEDLDAVEGADYSFRGAACEAAGDAGFEEVGW